MEQGPINMILFGKATDGGKAFFDALVSLELPHFIINVRSVSQLIAHMDTVSSILPSVVIFHVSKQSKPYLIHIKLIRKCPKYKRLSILLYDPKGCIDPEEAFAAGANMYMHKPADAKQLKTKLRHLFGTSCQYYDSNLNNETFFLSV